MNQRNLALFCSLAFTLAPAADARPASTLCGTHSAQAAEERYLHKRTLENRFLKTLSFQSLRAPRGAAQNVDAGDIAIVGATDGVIARRNPFNLNGRTVTFHLVGFGFRYATTTAENTYEPEVASRSTRLALGDDDSTEIQLPFDFTYYGQAYRSVNVNSDGNLTFLRGDGASVDRSLGRMVSGAPRISPLYTDLDPSIANAAVLLDSTPERVTLTWRNVPIFASSGNGQRQTFQVRLSSNGGIEFAYSTMNMTNEEAVVGLAPGAQQNGLELTALTFPSEREFAGAVADRFAGFESVDVTIAAQQFYATHEDAYDYLVIFNSLGIRTNSGGAIAYENTVRNAVTGFGENPFDSGEEYGSKRRLQAIMYMGPYEQYPADINAPFPQRVGTGETGLAVLGHEASHRFLAYVSVKDSAGRDLMFGRDAVHWGFNFNSEGSLIEGNRIVDNGEGVNPRFFAAGAAERIAPLDQYFFGFRAPEDVPDTFVVLNSSGPPNTSAPRPGARFNGTRRDIKLDELIEIAKGPRLPDHQVSQRKYRFGWVIVAAPGTVPSLAVERVERYRAQWESYWSQISEGRSSAEATLKRALNVSFFPIRELSPGETFRGTIRIESPLDAPLVVRLERDPSLLSLPETVTIPTGETSVEFDVAAIANSNGVTVVTATPERREFEAVESRIRVR